QYAERRVAAVRHLRRAAHRRHRPPLRLVAARDVRAQQAVLPFRRTQRGQRRRRHLARSPRRHRHLQRRGVGRAGGEGSREAGQALGASEAEIMTALPDKHGYFGEFGGQYVPETLMAALEEFEAAYKRVRRDREFRRELDDILANFVGRPTPLTEAPKFA